jgi:hypothetical protein
MGNKNSVVIPIRPKYRKEGRCIYWNDKIIEEAQVDSFVVLGFGYAKDNSNTFYKGKIIKYEPPSFTNNKSFEVDI